jgi:hypothetical protein
VKKISWALIGLLLVSGLCFSGVKTIDRDLQVIRQAVRENPHYQVGREVKWFKLQIYDSRSKKDKVRITLPLELVEWMIQLVEEEDLKVNCGGKKLNLRKLWQELKKLGAQSLIEIYDEGEVVKVWLE